MTSHDPWATPGWISELLPPNGISGDEKSMLALSVSIACASASHGGGPFGALVTDKNSRVIAVGWNNVIEGCDTTAHAEIHALRRALRALSSWDLPNAGSAPYTLYSSCAPCIQCFGAIYWSGLATVVAAAPRGYAEALGWDEGPVSVELWKIMEARKGTKYRENAGAVADSHKPFAIYKTAGGAVY